MPNIKYEKNKIESVMKEYKLMQVSFTSKIANSLQKLQSVTKLLLSAVLCRGGCLLAGVG